MPLTIVSVWALALPVRGRLETILTTFGLPAGPERPLASSDPTIISPTAIQAMRGAVCIAEKWLLGPPRRLRLVDCRAVSDLVEAARELLTLFFLKPLGGNDLWTVAITCLDF